MTEHTPWTVRLEEINESGEATYVVDSGLGEGLDWIKARDAGRLIAAAPDLMAAAQFAVAPLLCAYGPESPEAVIISDLLAAITKATA